MKQLSIALLVILLVVLYYLIVMGEKDSGEYIVASSENGVAVDSTTFPSTQTTLTSGVVLSNSDIRCYMRFPMVEGDCETVLGAYYDGWKKECVKLVGCSLLGVAPFNMSLEDPYMECLNSCYNKV